MTHVIEIGNMAIDVVFKNIKNVHLSVYPPTGRVRISAPESMNLDTIRAYAITRLTWIRQHQRKLENQERETPREYLERESHYVWGKRYLLKIEEGGEGQTIELKHSTLVIRLKSEVSKELVANELNAWYRKQVRLKAQPFITKWTKRLGVPEPALRVRAMKTKWGSCVPEKPVIWLNTDLAKKPLDCLEYVILHELAHLIEPNHGEKFQDLLDIHMSGWKSRRDMLNQLPLSVGAGR